MKPVRLTPPAKNELREATAWYDEKSPAVAREFIREVHSTFELLEDFPGAGASVPFLDDVSIRRFPVRRFPYQIVYVELEEFIEVIAIASDHRRPGYWVQR